MPVLVWLRDDLRLDDHPALNAAAASGEPVLAVVLRDRPLGGAEAWWRERSLAALAPRLAAAGIPLVRRRGDPAAVLPSLAAEAGVSAVFWNRRLDPDGCAADRAAERALAAAGIAARTLGDDPLFDPGDVCAGREGYYRVFTAFWKRCLSLPEPAVPVAFVPPAARFGGPLPASGDAAEPEPAWAARFGEGGSPGETAALDRLDAFLGRLAGYPGGRDRPDREAVSRLSPHLRFGEVSARRVWHAVRVRAAAEPGHAAGAEAFLREIGWREFARHLLHHAPSLPNEPLDRRFAAFPWREDPAAFAAWSRGRTGYPIVDAGMRQLWHTGWMHNRVRMIAGSFLVKDLLLPWQKGRAWFADTLTDADAASNAMNWQWIAGCGADAAPFFRVFNPVTQGERFDPDGAYVRAFVPELARLPARWIHRPWEAPPIELAAAGVRLGTAYPRPIVDHARAREAALAAFAMLKSSQDRG
jgi:deoxyribodipyrimidine photo-lyase